MFNGCVPSAGTRHTLVSPPCLLASSGTWRLLPRPSEPIRPPPGAVSTASCPNLALPCPPHKEPGVTSGHTDNSGLLPLQVPQVITAAEFLCHTREHGHRCAGGRNGHPWGPLFCLLQGVFHKPSREEAAMGGAEEAQRLGGGSRSVWLHSEDMAGRGKSFGEMCVRQCWGGEDVCPGFPGPWLLGRAIWSGWDGHKHPGAVSVW